MSNLTTYEVTKSTGEVYQTDMAASVTIEQARDYFMNNTFCDEDANGKETHWHATEVKKI